MGATPDVSIVIATYNRAAILSENIESVLAQDGVDFETIYVDDGSTDDTPAVLDAYRRKHAKRLTCLHVPHGGMGLARNAGARIARAPRLLFSDDDVTVPRDWAARMLARHEERRCDALTGGFSPFAMDTPMERYLYHRSRILFGDEAKPVRAAPMMSFLISRSLFWELGGFDSEPSEDWAFCREMRRRGKVIWYDPSIKVVHRFQRDWAAGAHRIRIPAVRGLYDRLDHGEGVLAYMLYSTWKYATCPFWSLWRFPIDLYSNSLRIESLFYFSRLGAYFHAFSGRRLKLTH